MFIELSCGLVNLENVTYIYKPKGDDYHRIFFKGDDPFYIGPGCTEEDIEKIKAILLCDDQHKGVFREKVRNVLAEDLRRS